MDGKKRLFVRWVLLFSLMVALIGCGSVKLPIDIPDLSFAYGVPLDKVGTLPIPAKHVSDEVIQQAYLGAYPYTLFDRHQSIDKGQTPCHSDSWYTVCVDQGKIVVTSNKTKQVAKTVDLGKVDYVGDLTMGSSFFTVVLAQGQLHTLYFKTNLPEKPGDAPTTKVVKRSYPLDGLTLADQRVTVVMKKQASPGFGIWLATVRKQELDIPLYEIDFVGPTDKIAFVKKLVTGDAPALPEMPSIPGMPALPDAPAIPDKPKVPEKPKFP